MAAPTCSQSDVRDVLLNMLLSLVFPESREVLSMLEASDRSIVAATVRDHGDHELLTEVCSLLRAEQSLHEQQARRIEPEEKVAEFVETHRLLAVAESALQEKVSAVVMDLRETQ